MGMWYVMHNGAMVNDFYCAEKLGEALALAKTYKAARELITGRACTRVTVVKCGGVPMKHHVDGTQTHYV